MTAGYGWGRRCAALAVVCLALLVTGCAGSGRPVIQIWARPGSLGPDVQRTAQEKFPQYELRFVANANISQSLNAAIRADAGLPDVSFFGGDLPDYVQASDRFLDLNEYGFAERRAGYFDVSLTAATASDGRQLAAPTDVGPYVFFYNAEQFARLGFPTDPAQVGAAISDWDDYHAMAETAAAADLLLCDAPDGLYEFGMYQRGYMFFDEVDGERTLALDDPRHKVAYDRAAAWAREGLCGADGPYSTGWNAAVAQQKVAAFIAPAYVLGVLEPAAEAATGRWRVAEATPGGPAAMAGSYVAAFASTPYPEVAAELAMYFSSAETQNEAYLTNGLIPSTVDSYTDPEVATADEFFGGQRAMDVFARTMADGPPVPIGPHGAAIRTLFFQALENVTYGGDPESEWRTVRAALDATPVLKAGGGRS